MTGSPGAQALLPLESARALTAGSRQGCLRSRDAKAFSRPSLLSPPPNSFLNPPLMAPPIPPGFFSSFFSVCLGGLILFAGFVARPCPVSAESPVVRRARVPEAAVLRPFADEAPFALFLERLSRGSFTAGTHAAGTDGARCRLISLGCRVKAQPSVVPTRAERSALDSTNRREALDAGG